MEMKHAVIGDVGEIPKKGGLKAQARYCQEEVGGGGGAVGAYMRKNKNFTLPWGEAGGNVLRGHWGQSRARQGAQQPGLAKLAKREGDSSTLISSGYEGSTSEDVRHKRGTQRGGGTKKTQN